MKITFNPLSGQFDFTGGSTSLLNLKGQVATVGALPLIGNTIGDVYQVADDLTFRVWDGTAWDNLGTLLGPPGPPGLGVQSVYSVGNWIVPIDNGGVISNVVSANTIALYPFTPRRRVEVSNLAARVTALAAGSNLQLAVYGSNAANKVTGSALAATGNLSGAAIATVSAPVTAFTMEAGIVYWMAVNSSGTPTMLGLSGGSFTPLSLVGVPLVADVFSITSSIASLRTVAHTFGTWPDLTAIIPNVLSGVNAQKGAVIAMQVSALP